MSLLPSSEKSYTLKHNPFVFGLEGYSYAETHNFCGNTSAREKYGTLLRTEFPTLLTKKYITQEESDKVYAALDESFNTTTVDAQIPFSNLAKVGYWAGRTVRTIAWDLPRSALDLVAQIAEIVFVSVLITPIVVESNHRKIDCDNTWSLTPAKMIFNMRDWTGITRAPYSLGIDLGLFTERTRQQSGKYSLSGLFYRKVTSPAFQRFGFKPTEPEPSHYNDSED